MVVFKVNNELIAGKLSRLTSVECGPCPVFARYSGICLSTQEKAVNTSVRVVEKCQFGHDSMCEHDRLAGSQEKFFIPMSLL
jgi:hypothetical protein